VRAIPCDERLRDWIRWRIERLTKEDQLAGRVVLFPNFRATNPSQRWVGVAMRREWRRACKRAGIPPVALYSGTKHSSATHLREAGVPLDQIQQLLGHADRRSTEIYAKLRSPALAKLIRMHHPTKRAES
jgi:site-specific recombinase XerD